MYISREINLRGVKGLVFVAGFYLGGGSDLGGWEIK